LRERAAIQQIFGLRRQWQRVDENASPREKRIELIGAGKRLDSVDRPRAARPSDDRIAKLRNGVRSGLAPRTEAEHADGRCLVARTWRVPVAQPRGRRRETVQPACDARDREAHILGDLSAQYR